MVNYHPCWVAFSGNWEVEVEWCSSYWRTSSSEGLNPLPSNITLLVCLGTCMEMYTEYKSLTNLIGMLLERMRQILEQNKPDSMLIGAVIAFWKTLSPATSHYIVLRNPYHPRLTFRDRSWSIPSSAAINNRSIAENSYRNFIARLLSGLNVYLGHLSTS